MNPEESGGFLQVSGLTYEIHNYLESPVITDSMEIFQGIDETKDRRVQNVMIGGEALDPNKTYTVAGSCYTLQEQGDGFSMFQGAEVVEQEGLPVDSEMLINYFTEELDGKVTAEQYGNPLGDGRITILTEAQAGTEDPENPSGDPGDEPAGGSENGNTDDKNSNGSDGSVKPVQTGDDSRIWPIAIVMAAALIAAGGSGIYMIRRRKNY